MRLPQVRFTVRRLMALVAIGATLATPRRIRELRSMPGWIEAGLSFQKHDKKDVKIHET